MKTLIPLLLIYFGFQMFKLGISQHDGILCSNLA